MEQMTSRMEEIALKTEEETVSMRIVTYVTLFFLPGTFVSVSSLLPPSHLSLTYCPDCHEHGYLPIPNEQWGTKRDILSWGA